jgi:hypothetical protein
MNSQTKNRTAECPLSMPLQFCASPRSTQDLCSFSETDALNASSIPSRKLPSDTLPKSQTSLPEMLISFPDASRYKRLPLSSQSTKTRASASNPSTPLSGKTSTPQSTQQSMNRSSACPTDNLFAPANWLKPSNKSESTRKPLKTLLNQQHPISNCISKCISPHPKKPSIAHTPIEQHTLLSRSTFHMHL